MLDSLVDGLVQVVWRNFLRLLILALFYWPGWLILRAVTLNRYPPDAPAPHSKDFVAGVALALTLFAFTAYFSA